MGKFRAVEICAGAGGQALGLEQAGFGHELVVELDRHACETLRKARKGWNVQEGDVADPTVWKPEKYKNVDLFAGGVPCPPFTVAGKRLGALDERDLFAWSVEQVRIMQPRALLLENVRGLSMPRFAGYRQHVLDRLAEFGYVADWKLLNAADYGVPQSRPRFVLVALQEDAAPYFRWPETVSHDHTVGSTLRDMMASDGWELADEWADGAKRLAPTIVGGSKKHGGADLGPTGAKRAWAEFGVDALGVANQPPQRGDRFDVGPKLTVDMVARLQGWTEADEWKFQGGKTARYRQIGNAFPPPMAAALGRSIYRALRGEGRREQRAAADHDAVYKILRSRGGYVTAEEICNAVTMPLHTLEKYISILNRDFIIDIDNSATCRAYRLGSFRAFVGQDDHIRHDAFLKSRSRIS
jgi:DNA (cytosine-5)-methyltransferase 1